MQAKGKMLCPSFLSLLEKCVSTSQVLPENQSQQDTEDAPVGALLPQEKPVHLSKTFQLIARGPH